MPGSSLERQRPEVLARKMASAGSSIGQWNQSRTTLPSLMLFRGRSAFVLRRRSLSLRRRSAMGLPRRTCLGRTLPRRGLRRTCLGRTCLGRTLPGRGLRRTCPGRTLSGCGLRLTRSVRLGSRASRLSSRRFRRMRSWSRRCFRGMSFIRSSRVPMRCVRLLRPVCSSALVRRYGWPVGRLRPARR